MRSTTRPSCKAVQAPGYPKTVFDRNGKPMTIFRAVDTAIAKDLRRRQNFDQRSPLRRALDAAQDAKAKTRG